MGTPPITPGRREREEEENSEVSLHAHIAYRRFSRTLISMELRLEWLDSLSTWYLWKICMGP